MPTKNLKPGYLVLTALLFVACEAGTGNTTYLEEDKILNEKIVPLVEKVLSPEERSHLTPEKIITELKAGNERFMRNNLTARNHSKQIREAVYGQFPKAIVLTCIDSRIPVEDVFDRGIGDIFVARVGGNVLSEDILGSMEYACKVAGAKLVLVLGHEHCETILSAIDGIDLGNITTMTSKIQPAIESITDYEGKKSSVNPEFVELVVKNNTDKTVNDIREKSPILKQMEDSGEIKITGAYYDLNEGQVLFR